LLSITAQLRKACMSRTGTMGLMRASPAAQVTEWEEAKDARAGGAADWACWRRTMQWPAGAASLADSIEGAANRTKAMLMERRQL